MELEDVLSKIDKAFGTVPRPEHFTNYRHCEECAEHDTLLRSRDRTTLTIHDLGSAGWNPIAFLTAEGFAFYFPALARLALSSNGETFLISFVSFHLYEALTDQEAGRPHRWLPGLSKEQCNAVLSYVKFVLDQKRDYFVSQGVESDTLDRAVVFWENECSRK